MNHEDIKQEIILYGKKLGEKSYSPAKSGNISIRYKNKVFITASQSCLWDLKQEDIVVIDISGKILSGSKIPSSEHLLHLGIYAKRPDINSIIHCHAPKTSAFAVTHKTLSLPILTESILNFGEIPVAEYAMPSSAKLVSNTVKYFKNFDIVLMSNHGIVAGATNIKDAFCKIDDAEVFAEIYLNALILGNIKPLSEKNVADLNKLKQL